MSVRRLSDMRRSKCSPALCVSDCAEDVILILYKKGPMTRSQIRTELGIGAQTQKDLVNWLLSTGLAREKEPGRYGTPIELTERGKQVAELVEKIREIIAQAP